MLREEELGAAGYTVTGLWSFIGFHVGRLGWQVVVLWVPGDSMMPGLVKGGDGGMRSLSQVLQPPGQ